MSAENVAVVRDIYEAWLRGDADRFLEGLDPDFEWDFSAYPLPDLPERGSGGENWLRMLDAFHSTWVSYEANFAEMIDAGDHVVVAVRERMQARGSDVPLEREIGHLTTVRDGRIVLVRAYRTKEEARQAAEPAD
jgi:ketosteroid isomerase-like protein